MTTPEIEQLELLASIDELVIALSEWADYEVSWGPINHCQALVKRLLSRVDTLRIRLESPLIVATYGGTGTGKSSLVNALLGKECTRTGKQRPTTTLPILLAHPETELYNLGLKLEDFEVVRIESALLRDIVLIDCPDPDTSEGTDSTSNLARLQKLIPHCDVLIYTTTQQKYRSAKVMEELNQGASGCRLLFVQTHAGIDNDIRDDWRNNLKPNYDVPEMFFVDSVRAFEEQIAGNRPSGDFARLQDILTTQFASAERMKVRRSNLIDLLQSGLKQCRSQLSEEWPHIEQLEKALEEQHTLITRKMTDQLTDALLKSRGLWERRLLDSVTEIWGFSPFSSVLRFYNSMGSLLASVTFYRARNSAQMAMIGALQGARWLKSRHQEQSTEVRLENLSAMSLDDNTIQESQIIIDGYVRSSGLDSSLADRSSLSEIKQEAAKVEEQFMSDASRRIDQVIEELAEQNSKKPIQILYESAFLIYLFFVLIRIGKNFFWDTFLKEFFYGLTVSNTTVHPVHLLGADFYIAAGIFFVLWTGVLVWFFNRRLRKGLTQSVRKLANELTQIRLTEGLYPKIESICHSLQKSKNRLETLAEKTTSLREQIAFSSILGGKRNTDSPDSN